jgi:hypothetical protein
MKFNIQRQFTFLFDVDEEFEQKEFEGTIPQALLLLNGGLTNRGVSPIPGTALADVMAMPGEDAQKIESLYLRTVSRKPTAAELRKWTTYVTAPREVILDDSAPQPPPTRRQAQQMLKPKQGKKNMSGGPDVLARLGARNATSQTPQQQAYEDVFWALLNSSEFMFNH